MSREIRRDFEVQIPEGATQVDEDLLVEEETDRQVDKMIDELGF